MFFCTLSARVGCAFALGCALVEIGRADDVVNQAAPAGPPIPVPGVMEFSGQLIARPWPLAALRARGLGDAQARALDAQSRARLVALNARHVPETDEYLVPVPAGRGDADYTLELAATGEYDYVHPDWLCFLTDTPNDPEIVSQYFHARLRSSLAWDTTTGAGVIIALVDSGIELSHPEFAGRLVPGFNSPDNLAQVNGGNVADIVGHGTLVAGCAAAAGNNALGGAGVARGASIMPVRASNLSNGSATISQITAGARWAADHGARVVSVSFTGVTNPTVQTTGAYVRTSTGGGGLLLWAAGNSGSMLTPSADWPDVIIVSSVDSTDARFFGSNFGVPIDVASPGVDIFGPALAGGYTVSTGTSFATPIAAGTLGLIFAANPTISVDDARAAFFAGCEDISTPGEDVNSGNGRVNAHRSVQIAISGLDAPITEADRATTPPGVARRIDVLANDADPLGRALTIQSFDTTTLLGGTVTLSSGTGNGDQDELLYTPPAPPAGNLGVEDSFEYMVSNGITARAVEVRVTVLSAAGLRAGVQVAGAAAGVAAEVHDFEALTPLRVRPFLPATRVLSTVWPTVNFPLTSVEFADSLLQDNLGALATGFLNIPAAGFYTLALESDEGSRLFIGNQLVVNNDGLHGMQRAEGTIGLQAGFHPVRIEFFERTGDCALIASIAGPGLPEQVIPASMLVHGSELVLDVNDDGGVDPDDLGDYINLYFSGDLRADVDGNGTIDPDDLGDYINAYFGR